MQAYAAGLLEGSLTWQLIHHHWYNTIRPRCEEKADECRKLTRYLRENAAVIRKRAELLDSTDPFWHMVRSWPGLNARRNLPILCHKSQARCFLSCLQVRLFYAQLDGLEAGWKFAVRRSRVSVSLESDDFLWLALASDVPAFQRVLNISDIPINSFIYFKSLPRDHSEPLVAIGHNTATQ